MVPLCQPATHHVACQMQWRAYRPSQLSVVWIAGAIGTAVVKMPTSRRDKGIPGTGAGI
eukprot:m.1424084 g.1424084  ORF g.1424084 m.1424084 type:complete len:59 (-) comp25059_c0_seq4:1387-1563(-)